MIAQTRSADGAAEQAAWAQEEHQEQDDEGDGVLVAGGDEAGRQGFQQAQQQAAGDGTHGITHAAEDGGGRSP